MFHIYYCYTTERMIKGFLYYQDKKSNTFIFLLLLFLFADII